MTFILNTIKKINRTSSSTTELLINDDFERETQHIIYNITMTGTHNVNIVSSGDSVEVKNKIIGKLITIVNTSNTYTMNTTVSTNGSEPGIGAIEPSGSNYIQQPLTSVTYSIIAQDDTWGVQIIRKSLFN